MAVTVTESSLGTVSTTEVELYGSDQTADRIVQVAVHVDSMATGDVFQIRAYETVNATLVMVDRWTLRGAQTDPLFPLPSLGLGIGYEFRVIKLAGTDRTVRVIRTEVT